MIIAPAIEYGTSLFDLHAQSLINLVLDHYPDARFAEKWQQTEEGVWVLAAYVANDEDSDLAEALDATEETILLNTGVAMCVIPMPAYALELVPA
ncbi:MAG: hypothetical protein HY326_02585 [Chloroflexi bacterium]|nr:hypothetical protein [Chloroflexota bacterium]